MIRGRIAPSLLALATVAGVLLGGCSVLRPATVPLRTVDYGVPGATDRLLLLLPGRADKPEDFEKRGFVAAARAAGVDAEIVAADAHLGYYIRRVVDRRLHEDVLAPARSHGARHVWLAGISLGGLGSVLQSSQFPQDVDGIVLIAPYLGPNDLLDEIERAGGLARWTPGPKVRQDFPAIWGWLKGYATAPQTRPPLLLAYGEHDRYVRGDRLLAAVLPPDRVLTAPGGHDWGTWTPLWNELLRHPLLSAALAAPAAAAPAAAR